MITLVNKALKTTLKRKDDISPVVIAIFDHIESPIQAHFHNPLVGHAGIYNSEKSLTDKYDENDWQAIMAWMKEHSKYQ